MRGRVLLDYHVLPTATIHQSQIISSFQWSSVVSRASVCDSCLLLVLPCFGNYRPVVSGVFGVIYETPTSSLGRRSMILKSTVVSGCPRLILRSPIERAPGAGLTAVARRRFKLRCDR